MLASFACSWNIVELLVTNLSWETCIYLNKMSPQVGDIGGNLIYAIQATEMFAIRPADTVSGALSSTTGSGTDSNAFVSTLAKVNRRLNPTQRLVTTGGPSRMPLFGIAVSVICYDKFHSRRVDDFLSKNCSTTDVFLRLYFAKTYVDVN